MPDRDDRWVWVSLPSATFGVLIRDGVVADAAPIARWAVGKPEREAAAYWRGRGARFAAVPAAAEVRGG